MFLFCCTQAQNPGQPPPPLLKRSAAVLDPLTKSVPGLLEGLYLMAKVKYLSGIYDTVYIVIHFFIKYCTNLVSNMLAVSLTRSWHSVQWALNTD